MADDDYDPDQMEYGPQPLDGLLEQWGLNNHEIVAASTEQVTHKMVAKGRKGRRLSRNIQLKLLRALNTAVAPKQKAAGEEVRAYELTEVFNYRGKV